MGKGTSICESTRDKVGWQVLRMHDNGAVLSVAHACVCKEQRYVSSRGEAKRMSEQKHIPREGDKHNATFVPAWQPLTSLKAWCSIPRPSRQIMLIDRALMRENRDWGCRAL